MTVSLTCRRCEAVIVGASEDELVAVAQRHAAEHGHPGPLDPEHLRVRIRRHNPAPTSPPAPPDPPTS